MADDDRRDHGRSDYYGRDEWRSGPGGGQRGESFHQGSGYGRGAGPGAHDGGRQTFGEAGGYNQGPGQSYGGFGGSQAGAGYGQGGFAGAAQGQQSYAGDGGYTGQTGSGYGRTQGGGDPREGAPEGGGLWNRARHAVSGVFGGEDQAQGRHRGRGPKGYSRSDERIQDDVNDRLTDDPFLDATHIEVAVAGGEVTLSGTVTARADKRRAEDLADNVSGVKHVQNNLRVQEAGAEPNRMGSVQERSGGMDSTGSMSGGSAGGEPDQRR